MVYESLVTEVYTDIRTDSRELVIASYFMFWIRNNNNDQQVLHFDLYLTFIFLN